MGRLGEMGSIAVLRAAYRSGALSPAEVLEETLSEARRTNEVTRAFVVFDEERALKVAREAARRYKDGTARVLEGVPVSIKDLIDMHGLQSRLGTHWVKEPAPAAEDAEVVRRLRSAGALIFGKTRLLECAYGVVNPADGPCLNPWDPSRTAGGSSGGAAASLASGVGFGAIGTDTGGSIRIPAAYCGVYGLKPTFGAVPTSGVLPLSWSLDHVGPLSRTAEDLEPLLQVLCGRRSAAHAPVKNVRLGLLMRIGRRSVADSVAAALDAARRQIEAAGVRIDVIDIEELARAQSVLMTTMMPEASAFHRGWPQRSHVRYAEGTARQIEHGQEIAAMDYVDARRESMALRAAVDLALQPLHALITPAAYETAPASDPAIEIEDEEGEGGFTGPFNVTGHPVISMPVPPVGSRMPVGMQLVGHRGGDFALIAIARALQDVVWDGGVPPLAQLQI